jgi:hypothetical protein
MPNEWREGCITALFKKGSRKMASNYRPVSLTCILCKVLEKLIRDHIVNHVKRNTLFSPKQFDFIFGRSTSLQLLYVLERWTKILDEGGSLDCIYLDFMKAFDKVPHQRLLYKLQRYGISPEIASWIQSFLLNRKQRVRVMNSYSEWAPVTICNNVAPVTNLCLGRATTRSHSSQWSKTKVAVEHKNSLFTLQTFHYNYY